jgi:TPR repeat protein
MFEIGAALLLAGESGQHIDLREAATNLKLSADRGHAGGQCGYGFCPMNGQGIATNYSEAARYYKLSAHQGNAAGQYCYGNCLANGRRIVMNYSEAARYYRCSAGVRRFGQSPDTGCSTWT